MNKKWIAVGFAFGSLGMLSVTIAAGLGINTTASAPRGFWWTSSFDGLARAGDVVAVCLPETEANRRYVGEGRCDSGLEPALKTVGAVAGDTVELSAEGAKVNGMLLANTAPLTTDHSGRALEAYPFGRYSVETGEVFLLSSWNKISYDSRYFGPVPISVIIARSKPIFVWR